MKTPENRRTVRVVVYLTPIEAKTLDREIRAAHPWGGCSRAKWLRDAWRKLSVMAD